jgi:energy-coupling factor transporter ATP-binding protein EcfA2
MPDASLPAAAADRHAIAQRRRARGRRPAQVLRSQRGRSRTVVRDPPRRCFGLLGPELARARRRRCAAASGLIEPRRRNDRNGRRARSARRTPRAIRVGVVPQQDNLDPDFTVTENLQVYGRYFGIDQAKLSTRIPALLEFAGLAGRSDAHLRTLSGGMKRRLTLRARSSTIPSC